MLSECQASLHFDGSAAEGGGNGLHRPVQVGSNLVKRLSSRVIVNVGFKFGQFVFHIVMPFYAIHLTNQALSVGLDVYDVADKVWAQYE